MYYAVMAGVRSVGRIYREEVPIQFISLEDEWF